MALHVNHSLCFFFCLHLLIGCGDTEESTIDGAMLYEAPHSDGNTFACSTCHALEEPAAGGIIRPGHPIGDAAGRPSYKNGQVASLLEAVNSCRQEWMAAPSFSAEDESWLALEEFLVSQSPAEAPALAFSIVEPPLDVTGGDPANGNAVFNQSCVVCHGTDAVGTERAPQLAGIKLDGATIAGRIRTSGSTNSPVYPNLTGGIMPFWSGSRLSDQDLIDIVAFIEESEAPGPGEEVGPLNIGGTRECASDHALVGTKATLSTRFHGVEGTVSVVDDCHLRFDAFSYDGNGIDIKIYTGQDGDYTSGTPISANMFNFPLGYDNTSFTLTLPESLTLDEFNGVSVWCVAVSTSFGDGIFQ